MKVAKTFTIMYDKAAEKRLMEALDAFRTDTGFGVEEVDLIRLLKLQAELLRICDKRIDTFCRMLISGWI